MGEVRLWPPHNSPLPMINFWGSEGGSGGQGSDGAELRGRRGSVDVRGQGSEGVREGQRSVPRSATADDRFTADTTALSEAVVIDESTPTPQTTCPSMAHSR